MCECTAPAAVIQPHLAPEVTVGAEHAIQIMHVWFSEQIHFISIFLPFFVLIYIVSASILVVKITSNEFIFYFGEFFITLQITYNEKNLIPIFGVQYY